MSWSFDDALSTDKDVIRYLIVDIDSASPLVSDEFIALYVSGGSLAQSSVRLAAAEVTTAIAAKYAGRAISISEGGSSVNWGDLSKRYRDLAAELRAADAAGDDTGLFEIAEFAFPTNVDELLYASALRGGR